MGCLNQRSGVSSMKANMSGLPKNAVSMCETVSISPDCVRTVSPGLTAVALTVVQLSDNGMNPFSSEGLLQAH